MKIAQNRRGRRTAFRAAALFAGIEHTLGRFFAAVIFRHPAAKDTKNHLTNSYRGGYYIGKAGSKKVIGACRKDCEVDSYV